MNSTHRIADYMDPASGTVNVFDPLPMVRQCARDGGFQSIIVLQRNRPVGLIRWPDIARSSIPDTSLARDIMLADCPSLTGRTSVQEASRRLEITGMDRLPVVDGDGELIGVFTQDTVKERVPMGNGNTSRPGGDPTHELPMRQTFTVYPGMEVYTSDGVLIGLVDRLFLESGTISEFLVSSTESASGHKLLNTGNIDKLVNETVILSVSRDAFSGLPDVDLDGFEQQ